jgi:hypothetical protein
MFSDGIIAQAATNVSNNGATYFSSAGNYARASWEADFRGAPFVALDNFLLSEFQIPVTTYDWHDFDGQGTFFQEIKVQSVVTQTVILQWNDPFLSQGQGEGASYDFDVYVFDENNRLFSLSALENIGRGAYCALHIVQRRMCTLLTLLPFYSALTRPRRGCHSQIFWHNQVCHWQAFPFPGTLCPSQVGHCSRWFWNNFRLPTGWICILNVLRSLQCGQYWCRGSFGFLQYSQLWYRSCRHQI